MALTPTSMSRGTYILGGPGRLAGENPAEATDRGITASQAYRTTQLNQANTQQQMALAQSQEGRAQREEQRTIADWERRQRELARAAAEAARNRAAVDAYVNGAGAGIRVPSAGMPDATGMPVIAPAAPPADTVAPAPAPAPTTSAPTIAPVPAPAAPAAPAAAPVTTGGLRVPSAGVQVASLDPTESFRVAMQTNPELFGVQVADASGGIPAGAIPGGQPARVDFSGVPFDVYPDGRIVNVLTGTELPVTDEYDALRNRLLTDAGVAGGTTAAVPAPQFTTVDPQSSAFMQDIDAILRQGDIGGAINRIGDRLATGGYGPMGSPLGGFIGYFSDSPEEAARRSAVSSALDWFRDPTNVRFLQQNPNLIAQAAADPIGFVAQQKAAAPEGTNPEPESTTPAEDTTQQDTPPEPVVEQPNNAGLRVNTGSPVQAAQDLAADQNIDLTQFYLRNPDRIFTDANELQSRRQYLDNLYNYYTQTRNVQGITALRAEYQQLALDEQMLNGQLALAGIQSNNFGPYQMLLQQRFPNNTVEVRPYTDGTMDVFIDGVSQYPADSRPTFADVLEQLAGAYNQDYIARQQALAAQAIERSQFIFEKGFESELRTAEKYSEAQISQAFASGELTKIGDMPDGSGIYQILGSNGQRRTVRFTQSTTRDPATGQEVITYTPEPVDMSALQ